MTTNSRGIEFFITGFGPFEGCPVNPTAALVDCLPTVAPQLLSIPSHLHTNVVETSAAAVRLYVEDTEKKVATSSSRTVVLLHFGVDTRPEAIVSVERFAYNEIFHSLRMASSVNASQRGSKRVFSLFCHVPPAPIGVHVALCRAIVRLVCTELGDRTTAFHHLAHTFSSVQPNMTGDKVVLKVRSPVPNSPEYVLEMPPASTVADVKLELRARVESHPNPSAIRLIYGGRILLDSMPLNTVFTPASQSFFVAHMIVRASPASSGAEFVPAPAPAFGAPGLGAMGVDEQRVNAIAQQILAERRQQQQQMAQQQGLANAAQPRAPGVLARINGAFLVQLFFMYLVFGSRGRVGPFLIVASIAILMRTGLLEKFVRLVKDIVASTAGEGRVRLLLRAFSGDAPDVVLDLAPVSTVTEAKALLRERIPARPPLASLILVHRGQLLPDPLQLRDLFPCSDAVQLAMREHGGGGDYGQSGSPPGMALAQPVDDADWRRHAARQRPPRPQRVTLALLLKLVFIVWLFSYDGPNLTLVLTAVALVVALLDPRPTDSMQVDDVPTPPAKIVASPAALQHLGAGSSAAPPRPADSDSDDLSSTASDISAVSDYSPNSPEPSPRSSRHRSPRTPRPVNVQMTPGPPRAAQMAQLSVIAPANVIRVPPPQRRRPSDSESTKRRDDSRSRSCSHRRGSSADYVLALPPPTRPPPRPPAIQMSPQVPPLSPPRPVAPSSPPLTRLGERMYEEALCTAEAAAAEAQQPGFQLRSIPRPWNAPQPPQEPGEADVQPPPPPPATERAPDAMDAGARECLDALHAEFAVVMRPEKKIASPGPPGTPPPAGAEAARMMREKMRSGGAEAASAASETRPENIDEIDQSWFVGDPPPAEAREGLVSPAFPRQLLTQLDDNLDPPKLPDAPTLRPSWLKVVIELDTLKPTDGANDLLDARMALYDPTIQAKLSEDFCFPCHAHTDLSPKPMFSLPPWRRGSSVWALLRVYREFPERKRAPGAEPLARILGCAVFEIVGEEGQVFYGQQTGTMLKTDLRDQKSLFQLIADIRDMKKKGAKSEAKKIVPLALRINVQKPKIRPGSAFLDPMWQPVKEVAKLSCTELLNRTKSDLDLDDLKRSLGLSAKKESGEVTEIPVAQQELFGFPTTAQRAFTNLMYIYPEHLVLPKLKRKLNLCITVYFRDMDTPFEQEESTKHIWFSVMPLRNKYGGVMCADEAPADSNLRLRIHLVSSVYPQDESLSRFFQEIAPPAYTAARIDDMMSQALMALQLVRPDMLLKHCATILRRLLAAFCYKPAGRTQTNLFIAYELRNVNTEKSVAPWEIFEGLGSAFAFFLRSTAQQKENHTVEESVLGNTWFIIEAISKSLIMELAKLGRLNQPGRNKWLSDEAERWGPFSESLITIAEYLGIWTSEAVERGKISLDGNAALAFFIRDAFHFYSRGILVTMPTRRINPLMTLIVDTAIPTLITPFPDVRIRALGMLFNLLVKLDDRYVRLGKKNARKDIAQLFFPILSTAIANRMWWPRWKEIASSAERQALLSIILYSLEYIGSGTLLAWWNSESTQHLSLVLDVLMTAVRTFDWRSLESLFPVLRTSRRKLFDDACSFCPAAAGLTRAPSPISPESERTSISGAMATIRKQSLFLTGTKSLRLFTDRFRDKAYPPMPQFEGKAPASPVNSPGEVEDEDIVLGSGVGRSHKFLSEPEARLTCGDAIAAVLNTLELFLSFLDSGSSRQAKKLQGEALSVLIACLRGDHTQRFLGHLFPVVRCYIVTHRNVVLSPDTRHCEDLCRELLRFCNSPTDDERKQAIATLFVLCRSEYKETGAIDRVWLSCIKANAVHASRDTSKLAQSLQSLAYYARCPEPAAAPASPVMGNKRKKEYGALMDQQLLRDIGGYCEWIGEAVTRCPPTLEPGADAEEASLSLRGVVAQAEQNDVLRGVLRQHIAEAPVPHFKFDVSADDLDTMWSLVDTCLTHFKSTMKIEETKKDIHSKLVAAFYSKVDALLEHLGNLSGVNQLELLDDHRPPVKAAFRRLTFFESVLVEAKIQGFPDPTRPGMAECETKYRKVFLLMENKSSTPLRAPRPRSILIIDKKSLFAQNIQEFCTRLMTINSNHGQLRRMREIGGDTDTALALQFEIAKEHRGTPELFFSCLHDLAAAHRDAGNFVEAGMCEVFAARVMLDTTGSSLPVRLDAIRLERLYPPLAHWKEGLQRFKIAGGSEALTSEHLLSSVHSAVDFLKKAEYYEFCVTLLETVIPLFASRNETLRLAETHQMIHELYVTLHKRNEARLLGNFLRVGFYGKPFGTLDGHEYVYQEKPGVHLFKFTEELAARFHSMGEVVVLDSTQSIPENTEDGRMYIQVTALKPYFTREQLASHPTVFSRNAVIRSFAYETPFTKTAGKSQSDDIREQWKRKVIIRTEETFPSVLKRHLVSEKTTQELSPIENAVETLERRTNDLREEIEKIGADTANAAHLPPLLRLLQGSLRTQVNAGVFEYFNAFLGKNAPVSSPEEENYHDHKKRLRSVLRDFCRVCKRGLGVLRDVMNSDTAGAQSQEYYSMNAELRASFQELEKLVDSKKDRHTSSSSTTHSSKFSL
eukprot:m51a1_g3057 putative dock family protein (2591) ;mRNA; f:986524-998003